VTFGTLPYDILLVIFDFYLARNFIPEDAWHTLVHVCKQWRFIVFASPHRLQLQLLCTNKTPVQNTLDVWPELPMAISGRGGMSGPQDANNIIAALTHHSRVVKIDLDNVPNSVLKGLRAMEMTDPFSALTSLQLRSRQTNAPALPDSFLGGAALRLQTLSLRGIPFPALPNLLLSTHDLVELNLLDIPLSGYISPEAMVSGLSALTGLKELLLEFRSPHPLSRTDRENRLVPRLTRVVLPALTSASFKGDSEYLEDIVAQIDTPLLTRFRITFFNQLIFDTPSLRHFITRTEALRAFHRAQVAFREGEVNVGLYLRNGNSFRERLSSEISCRPSDWQLSSAAQFCASAFSSLPTLERLEIYIKRSWKDDMENSQWLELLHSFTSMKDLFLRDESIQHVVLALDQLARERVTEALPALQNIFLQGPQPWGPVEKAIGKFVAARQLSGHPVAVRHRVWPTQTWQQMH
jgi:hypothetical protein